MKTALLGAAAALAINWAAAAAEIEVKMLDKGAEGMMVFCLLYTSDAADE